jgi:hypothetical protein
MADVYLLSGQIEQLLTDLGESLDGALAID